MDQSKKIIIYINIAHFIDHYAMLIFAAAVIVIAPTFNMKYGELLPYATPGFIAFGAGSLLTGWLGDKWSRQYDGYFLIRYGICPHWSFIHTNAVSIRHHAFINWHDGLHLPSRWNRNARI